LFLSPLIVVSYGRVDIAHIVVVSIDYPLRIPVLKTIQL